MVWFVLLWIFNLIDAVSTDIALTIGYGHELNPLMKWAYAVSPGFFYLVKFSLLALFTVTIYFGAKNHNYFNTILKFHVFVFGLLALWHGYMWFSFFRGEV